jgi:polysaccharide biosynthesis/export protein
MNSNCVYGGVVGWLILAAGTCLLPAAESESPPKTALAPADGGNLTLSVRPPAKRAAWQQRLTLGPGDVVNMGLFDVEDSARPEVPIGPDGRISFREARDVMAAGLTVDELRAKLDEVLSKYYQNPRTIVTPVTFRSKKYIVLGAVANGGVFVFDRPLSVIEALGRAGGVQTGLYGRDTIELADLGRSFIVRNGQRVSADFERLFEKGDLSQNVPLEPDDFLYIAPASANEIYVLGQVLSPGVAAFLPRSSTMSAIAARGGFTTRAWRSRVLVVRGSLTHPQTFVVDTAAILSAKQPDFKLQARDIVYVSQNPWVKAAEILDGAATAFIQGFTVNTIGRKLPPLSNPNTPWIK